MEKVNIKPFLSGDRVYYVGKRNHLPKDTILIVDDCYKPDCGCSNSWVASIRGYEGVSALGRPVRELLGQNIICGDCGKLCTVTTPYRESFCINLRPAQELNAPLMTFTKVAEVEKEQVLILN